MLNARATARCIRRPSTSTARSRSRSTPWAARWCSSPRHLKARKVGYINHDDAYGGWNLEAARAAKQLGGVDLQVQSVNPNITDVTAPMLKIRAANPDVLLLTTYARPAALIIKKAQELGWNKPIVLAVNGTADLEAAGGERRQQGRLQERLHPGRAVRPARRAQADLGLRHVQTGLSRPGRQARPSADLHALRHPAGNGGGQRAQGRRPAAHPREGAGRAGNHEVRFRRDGGSDRVRPE